MKSSCYGEKLVVAQGGPMTYQVGQEQEHSSQAMDPTDMYRYCRCQMLDRSVYIRAKKKESEIIRAESGGEAITITRSTVSASNVQLGRER